MRSRLAIEYRIKMKSKNKRKRNLKRLIQRIMFKFLFFISILILSISSQKLKWCHFTMEVMPNATMYFSDCGRACFNISASMPSPAEAMCIAYSGHMIGYDFWVDQISGEQEGWLRSQYVFVTQPFTQEAGCICVDR